MYIQLITYFSTFWIGYASDGIARLDRIYILIDIARLFPILLQN